MTTVTILSKSHPGRVPRSTCVTRRRCAKPWASARGALLRRAAPPCRHRDARRRRARHRLPMGSIVSPEDIALSLERSPRRDPSRRAAASPEATQSNGLRSGAMPEGRRLATGASRRRVAMTRRTQTQKTQRLPLIRTPRPAGASCPDTQAAPCPAGCAPWPWPPSRWPSSAGSTRPGCSVFESPIWLNRYTEYAIILAFGALAHPRRGQPLHAQAPDHPGGRGHRPVVAGALAHALLRALCRLSCGSQPVFPALHRAGHHHLLPRPGRWCSCSAGGSSAASAAPASASARPSGFAYRGQTAARPLGVAAAPCEVASSSSGTSW